MKKKVIVIGAGAAGMMAALRAAERGAEVCVIEHNKEPLKKLLSTGNGRCNLTNLEQSLSHYHCTSDEKGRFRAKALASFNAQDTIAYFNRIGVPTRVKKYDYDKGAYVYPITEEAKTVRAALLDQAAALNVEILTERQIISVALLKDCDGRPIFRLDTNKGVLGCEAIVIATGSCAAPVTGSDGSGIQIPAAYGHYIVEFMPSLCAIQCVGGFFRELKGVRVHASLKLEIREVDPDIEDCRLEDYEACPADHYRYLEQTVLGKSYQASGELQFTDYGVSGIPVFQLSRYVSLAVKLRRERYLIMDLLPEFTKKALSAELERRREVFADRTQDHLLNGLLPEKLCRVILKRARLHTERGIYLLTDAEIAVLISEIKTLRVSILDTNGFDASQCAIGGVDPDEIDPSSMESKVVDEMYFAGEVMDVDGDCGGYNLQWAWTTGTIAGLHAAVRKRYRRYPAKFPSGAEEA